MKTYWRIEVNGEDVFVCKNCGHHHDAPYEKCPDCGWSEKGEDE